MVFTVGERVNARFLNQLIRRKKEKKKEKNVLI